MPVTHEEITITLTNCNSIEHADFTLRKNALNIKYGPNGTGKSTIAKALELQAVDAGALSQLQPFKYRKDPSQQKPEVKGAEKIRSVLVFNETYVNSFVFQRNEVLRNSFEVFIETTKYRETDREIEKLLTDLKEAFQTNQEFTKTLDDFNDIHRAFTFTKNGKISKTSKGYKALGSGMGGRLQSIPVSLSGYSKFLGSSDPASWIAWQAKGKEYMQLSENCPFCATDELDKSRASNLSEQYEVTSVRNLATLRSAIDRLGDYFEVSHRKKLIEITTSIEGLTSEQEDFLATLTRNIETFLMKLNALRDISFATLKEENDLSKALSSKRIDLKYLPSINSPRTESVVSEFNNRVREVEQGTGILKGQINIQKNIIAKQIKHHETEINEFLKSAGYQYIVKVEEDADSYRMIIEHQDIRGHIESAASHLSYGEKNAFALVLFMYHVLREQPDLVVLDDPVSSFDKTKKYAILYKLFHGRNGIKNHTTLFLTHDIEPAIDIIVNQTSRLFAGASPAVHFLRPEKGVVREIAISSEDILPFSSVCKENISSSQDSLIKCIYLRRLLEVDGSNNNAWNMLSTLLHGRAHPEIQDYTGTRREMNPDETRSAERFIRFYIPDFSYGTLLSAILDPIELHSRFLKTSNGYEKVQLFRIISQQSGISYSDSSLQKFINESFHIENEYLMQLNPRKFDTVPDHIILSCESLLNAWSTSRQVEI